MFCYVPIKLNLHDSLNLSEGVTTCRDLEGASEDELCKHVSSQSVTGLGRVKVCENNELLLTNTFVLTFNIPMHPPLIKYAYLNITS